MEYLCACKCGNLHNFNAFLVEPIETLWFLNKEHREKFKESRFGVNTTKTVPTSIPLGSYY